MQVQTGETGLSKAKAVETKKCPFCAEEILAEALKCKHCKEMLDGKDHAVASTPIKQEVVVPTVLAGSDSKVPSSSSSSGGLQRIKGKLQTLGKGTWIGNRRGSKSEERYSIIEIDGTKYRNVYVPDHIATFLDKAMNDDVEILMGKFLFKSHIVAIRTRHTTEKSLSPIYASIVFSLLMVPMYGIGLIFLAINFSKIKGVLCF